MTAVDFGHDSLISRRSFLAALTAMPALASCGTSPAQFDTGGQFQILPGAPQRPHPEIVPHTTRSGYLRSTFDPRESFFPIGAYHAVSDENTGRGYQLADLRSANFNAVFAWGGQRARTIVDECFRHGLQAVISDPGDDEVRRLAGHPALLAYDVDHEPSIEPVSPASWERLERFRARRRRIRELDPGRAVLTVDSPSSSAPRRERWLAWADAGDIAAHWKYPFTTQGLSTLSGERGLPEIIDLARQTTRGAKPVWHIAQAFETPLLGWRMPRERDLRALAYTALIHGATGIFWFALDSFVTRDGQVLGFAPKPESDYRFPLDPPALKMPPMIADDAARGRGAATWTALTRLNTELHALAPAVLSPTPNFEYAVAARGRYVSPTPVRTLLKRSADGWALLAVNIDDAVLDVEYRLPWQIRSVRRFDGIADTTGQATDNVLLDRLQRFSATLYHLVFSTQA